MKKNDTSNIDQYFLKITNNPFDYYVCHGCGYVRHDPESRGCPFCGHKGKNSYTRISFIDMKFELQSNYCLFNFPRIPNPKLFYEQGINCLHPSEESLEKLLEWRIKNELVILKSEEQMMEDNDLLLHNDLSPIEDEKVFFKQFIPKNLNVKTDKHLKKFLWEFLKKIETKMPKIWDYVKNFRNQKNCLNFVPGLRLQADEDLLSSDDVYTQEYLEFNWNDKYLLPRHLWFKAIIISLAKTGKYIPSIYLSYRKNENLDIEELENNVRYFLLDTPERTFLSEGFEEGIDEEKFKSFVQQKIIFSRQFGIDMLIPILTWRWTQGIYIFNNDLLKSFDVTKITKCDMNIIYNAMSHLPEWGTCLFFEDHEITGHIASFICVIPESFGNICQITHLFKKEGSITLEGEPKLFLKEEISKFISGETESKTLRVLKSISYLANKEIKNNTFN